MEAIIFNETTVLQGEVSNIISFEIWCTGRTTQQHFCTFIHRKLEDNKEITKGMRWELTHYQILPHNGKAVSCNRTTSLPLTEVIFHMTSFPHPPYCSTVQLNCQSRLDACKVHTTVVTILPSKLVSLAITAGCCCTAIRVFHWQWHIETHLHWNKGAGRCNFNKSCEQTTYRSSLGMTWISAHVKN